MVQAESGRLRLADIITIADDLSRMTSRITDNGREVLGEVLKQMEEMANEQGPAAIDAYSVARRNLESEWAAVESVLDDTVNESNRSIHTFVTQADYHVRRFENDLQRQTARERIKQRPPQPRKRDSRDTEP